MTLVTDILARVARQVSVSEPDNWLTATATEHLEIRDDFLLETVDDVLDRCDLPEPIGATYTLTGTGAETYALPSQFKRLQRDPLAVYETTTVRRALTPATDDGFWTHLKEIGSTGAERFYRLTGYEGNWSISIYREPETTIEVKIHYVTRYWMVNAAGAYGWQFTATDDRVLLPRRVLEAGTVMRWRDRRGLPMDGKDREYETLIARMSNDRRNRRTVYFGEPYERARPWDVPVPDQIPTS